MYETPSSLWPCEFEAAIFDFDGTIALTGDIWHQVDRLFLERRGLTWTPDYAVKLAALGFDDGARYTIEAYGLDGETPEDICAEWTEMSEELYASTVVLRDGVEDYVRALRDAGVRVALATTNNSQVLGSLRPRVDVFDLFDSCVFGHDVERNKNHPDIYLEAARRLDVSPQKAIVFEDIVPALESAKRAGCTTCAVASGEVFQNVDDLRAAADLFLRDWRDIALS